MNFLSNLALVPHQKSSLTSALRHGTCRPAGQYLLGQMRAGEHLIFSSALP
jgi:hypothetical protein